MLTEPQQKMFEHLFHDELFLIPPEQPVKSFSLVNDSREDAKLLILLKDELNQQAKTSDIELLLKIADFKEYQVGSQKVKVVNLAHQQLTFIKLTKDFIAPYIIAFGILPRELELQIDHQINTVIHFRERHLVFTATLDEISRNEKLKKQFFMEALKPMFIPLKSEK
jgi:hypothetical protein